MADSSITSTCYKHHTRTGIPRLEILSKPRFTYSWSKPKNRQCRVDLWRRLAERDRTATGLSHIFHTTPENPSYLCFRCSSRYFTALFTSTGEISMSLAVTAPTSRFKVIGFWVLKILFGLMFIGAGCAKLYGPPAMIAEFDAVGLGQWFRYFTGALEIIGAILLLERFPPDVNLFVHRGIP